MELLRMRTTHVLLLRGHEFDDSDVLFRVHRNTRLQTLGVSMPRKPNPFHR